MDVNPVYFTFVLMVRGSISAFFKTTVLKYMVNKSFNLQRVRENLHFNVLPAILFYMVLVFIDKGMINKTLSHLLGQQILSLFIPTMITIRTLKTAWKELRK